MKVLSAIKRALVCVMLVLFAEICMAQQSLPGSAVPCRPSTTNAAPPVVPLGDPIFMVPLKYPKDALKQKIEGSVVLELLIDEKGKVEDVTVESGNPELVEAAVPAVRKWKYAPYLVGGKAREVASRLTFKFGIDAAGKPDISAIYMSPAAPANHEVIPGEVFTVRDGVSAPRVIHSADPNYTEAARNARYQGTIVLSLVVGADGKPYDIQVVRRLGYGLDDEAIKAVKQWQFQPAIKDGKPVATLINVEVTFRLR